MIASLQNFLENARIETIILLTFVYLLILWLLVPTWVYLDAKKKFNQNWIPILLFIVVLPLNIPGLIFYIIIRPENNNIWDDSDENDHVMNVPIVRFLDGKNDFVMSFEVKVNSDIIDKSRRPHLNMNVSIEADDEAIKFEETENKRDKLAAVDATNQIERSSLKEKVLERFQTIKNFFIVDDPDEEKGSESSETDETST